MRPLRRAFFLALALTMMLPTAFHVLDRALPGLDFSLVSLIASATFFPLLAIEHSSHLDQRRGPMVQQDRLPAMIPLIIRTMITIPSLLLGAAFAVSRTETAILIFIVIMMHTSSAAFGLALMMARRRLTHWQV